MSQPNTPTTIPIESTVGTGTFFPTSATVVSSGSSTAGSTTGGGVTQNVRAIVNNAGVATGTATALVGATALTLGTSAGTDWAVTIEAIFTTAVAAGGIEVIGAIVSSTGGASVVYTSFDGSGGLTNLIPGAVANGAAWSAHQGAIQVRVTYEATYGNGAMVNAATAAYHTNGSTIPFSSVLSITALPQ